MSNQITSANDWFFIHPSANGETHIVQPIAVWVLQANGDVFGLVANNPATSRGRPNLAPVPSVAGGVYKHISTMTDKEKERIGLLD